MGEDRRSAGWTGVAPPGAIVEHMGLDAAELAIAYEEELGIRITDKAAGRERRSPRQ